VRAGFRRAQAGDAHGTGSRSDASRTARASCTRSTAFVGTL
jgi:hypothetical protein